MIARVVDPGCRFAELDARLAALGFRRTDDAPFTEDTIAGEPELAGWTRGDDERLTYTFNPVVSLRVLAATPSALAALARLPLVDVAAVERLLGEREPRRVLLGILAARVLAATSLRPAIAALRGHPERVVRQAAEAAWAALAGDGEAAARADSLALLRRLCEQASPLLAELVGPDGARAAAQLHPRADDYARVFAAAIAEPARAAYEALWATLPRVEPMPDAADLTLRVDAAPASMLGSGNELSDRFPGGYRKVAPLLVRERIWLVWRYLRPGDAAGMRYEGLVRLDDRWIWLPKPYRVLCDILPHP